MHPNPELRDGEDASISFFEPGELDLPSSAEEMLRERLHVLDTDLTPYPAVRRALEQLERRLG